MVQDTLAGLLGAALIVGSMAGAIQFQATDTPGEEDVEGPPPAPERSSWSAEGCRAGSIFWTPPLEALDEVVGPNYEPAPGPVPDRGLFWLFVFECQRSSVNGLRISPPSGAAALAAVEEPDDTRNVTAPDGWAAVPTWYGPSSGPVSEVFQRHGFSHTTAQTGLGVASNALSDTVRVTIDSPTGVLEADLTLTGSESRREVEGALVGTDPDRFSVFSGPETMQRTSDGTARVETRGTTWVERLDLDPTPFRVAYDRAMSWDFTFRDEPWDEAAGNATDATLPADPGAAPGPGSPTWPDPLPVAVG